MRLGDGIPKTPTVNLVIDVGDWDPVHSKGSREEHDAYIKKINDSVEALRQQGIPTIFIQIGNDTQAHPSAGGDPALAKSLRMSELVIKPGEDIFEKRFMSSFTTREDVEKSAALEKYVTGQRGDGADYKTAHFGKTTLYDLLEEKGAQHVTIMGAVAQFCITDTAIDAARKGLDVTVLTDTLQAWNDRKKLDRIVWADPEKAAREVAETLADVRANPEARGIEKTDTAAIEATKTIQLATVDEFLQSRPGLNAAAQSKFLTTPSVQAEIAVQTAPKRGAVPSSPSL